MTLNGVMTLILCYFTELSCTVHDVVVKQLLGLLRFQNLLLILYDRIKTMYAIIQRLFRQIKLITQFYGRRCIDD